MDKKREEVRRAHTERRPPRTFAEMGIEVIGRPPLTIEQFNQERAARAAIRPSLTKEQQEAAHQEAVRQRLEFFDETISLEKDRERRKERKERKDARQGKTIAEMTAEDWKAAAEWHEDRAAQVVAEAAAKAEWHKKEAAQALKKSR